MQLPLFQKTKKDIKEMSLREKWAYFFKYADETTEEDLEKLIGKDQIIKRAYDELDRFGWSEKELNNYESVEMKKAADEAVKEAAYEKGQDKGRQEGEKKKAKEIILKMLKENLPIEQVSNLTGLSIEEIESLQS